MEVDGELKLQVKQGLQIQVKMVTNSIIEVRGAKCEVRGPRSELRSAS